MKSKHLKLTIISILLLIAIIFIFNLICRKPTTESTEDNISTSYDTQPYADDKKYTIPDGEYTGTIGSVLRIDDLYVDDQYYAYTEIVNLNQGNLVLLELSNDIKILLLLNSENATRHLEPVSLDVFRKIMRAEAKTSGGFSRVLKLKIKDNLILEIVETDSR